MGTGATQNKPQDQPAPTGKPTQEELTAVLQYCARLVVGKFQKGRPPDSCDNDWSHLKAQVFEDASHRMRNFRHGGSKTLREFAYISCYFALRDIQRRAMRTHNMKILVTAMEHFAQDVRIFGGMTVTLVARSIWTKKKTPKHDRWVNAAEAKDPDRWPQFLIELEAFITTAGKQDSGSHSAPEAPHRS